MIKQPVGFCPRTFCHEPMYGFLKFKGFCPRGFCPRGLCPMGILSLEILSLNIFVIRNIEGILS